MDPRLDSPRREGLTGTAEADLYSGAGPRETVTTAPDRRPHADQPGWRHDFPVDWPQDVYVARRDFMKFLVLTSGAFTAGQVWIGLQNWWRRRRGEPEIRRVAAVADLAAAGALVFRYPGEHDPCVLLRTASGELVAYGQKCSHLSCAVVPRGAELHCPCHEGRFDLATGRPLAGPPRRPLTRVVVEQRGEDIYATGIEWRTV